MKSFKLLGLSLLISASFATQAGWDGNPQGGLGLVNVDPSGRAPLTALIELNGAHNVSDVRIHVAGKGEGGVAIDYPVQDNSVLHYDGIPVFGLYPDHLNQVTVHYQLAGEPRSDRYQILTQPVFGPSIDGKVRNYPEVQPVHVEPQFKDRLYWVNHLVKENTKPIDLQWGNGGALQWSWAPVNFITDTQGEVRWYLPHQAVWDPTDPSKTGALMGVKQLDNGDVIFGQGQRYYRMDLLGNIVFDRALPRGFADFSHEIREMDNGHMLMRVARKNYLRPDGERVTTVRDHIIEVDVHGKLVEAWDLNTILDPLRDDLLKGADRGAICLNLDLEHAGEAVIIEPDAPFGDIPGVGTGRNWAHVNSVDHDPTDDSIVLSVRHQGIVKIGRDKEVKWILAPAKGWRGDLADKVLTPLDSNGNKLRCATGHCGPDFEYSYMQHTAWLAKEKGTLMTFDNGDARNMRQPMFKKEKYSRAVEYKIDEANMTVSQQWQFGKERGYDWYSPITSSVNYQADRDTQLIYSASAGLFEKEIQPYSLLEVGYGSDEVKVELNILPMGKAEPSYQSVLIEADKLF
ncbi:aryl-sulfate sulfotransferase [Ferrimonas pelagia]|uniref:Aryl-sulfate sulfotransferase n=1 Tax=Ferrimonas pelagia TaxID=1177826 RepID=A0ABP9ERV3_9GAMM